MSFSLTEVSSQVLVVFAVTAGGYLLSRVQVKGVGLGTASIFLVGMLFGHFGASSSAALQTLGLILFITSVGLSAGPTFVRRLKESGRAYALLCMSVVLAGAAVCAAVIAWTEVDAPLAVGIMTGAFTTSPGFAAAKEAALSAGAVSEVAAGYGLTYPIGVVSKVLFIQLVPRLLHADMERERALISASKASAAAPSAAGKRLDALGFFPFSLAVLLGILLGSVSVALPGGGTFSLGTTGGPLIVGLLLGHIGRIGPIDLRPDPKIYATTKEIGLVLFFSCAGIEGGHALAAVLAAHGARLLLYGFALVAVPLAVGYVMFRKVLKLPLLNGLGSMTASMTSTPSLAVLIDLAGTDDVASAYATTYPIAMVLLVLIVQVLMTL